MQLRLQLCSHLLHPRHHSPPPNFPKHPPQNSPHGMDNNPPFIFFSPTSRTTKATHHTPQCMIGPPPLPGRKSKAAAFLLTCSPLSQFLNNPAYANNDIGMLATFVDYLNPSNLEHRLNDICEVSRLEQGANESTATYLSCVRGFANRLAGVSMESVMLLFAILGMDHSKYDGLLSRFTSGDTSVVSADLPALELLIWGRSVAKLPWVYLPPQRCQPIKPLNRIHPAPIPPMIEYGALREPDGARALRSPRTPLRVRCALFQPPLCALISGTCHHFNHASGFIPASSCLFCIVTILISNSNNLPMTKKSQQRQQQQQPTPN